MYIIITLIVLGLSTWAIAPYYTRVHPTKANPWEFTTAILGIIVLFLLLITGIAAFVYGGTIINYQEFKSRYEATPYELQVKQYRDVQFYNSWLRRMNRLQHTQWSYVVPDGINELELIKYKDH